MKLYTPLLTSILTSLIFGATLALPLRAAPRLLDRTLVIINDDVILESDIQKFLNKIKSKSFQELFGGLDAKTLQNPDSVLELLIEEKLINQQVKKLDLQASDQEVDGQIKAIVKRNGIGTDQLTQRLKQLGTTMDDYREGIRRQIERRNLIEREIKPTLEVTEEQLRHFYMRNIKPEEAETQYRIAHILIESSKGGAMSTLERAKKIEGEVAAHPEDFEKLTKEYSDDSSTSATGGVLGFFSISQLAKEFREVVPKTAAGSVTPPVKAPDGYHIIKVLETQKGDFATLPKERKEALRNQMLASEVEKKMALWLERKKSESYIKRVGK